jgi:CBS domain-containing protein
VTISQIAREVIANDRPADRVNVYEVMAKPVLTLPIDMQTKYAVRLLVEFKLTRALVVDQSRIPVGIVTLRDMVLRHDEAKAFIGR